MSLEPEQRLRLTAALVARGCTCAPEIVVLVDERLILAAHDHGCPLNPGDEIVDRQEVEL